MEEDGEEEEDGEAKRNTAQEYQVVMDASSLISLRRYRSFLAYQVLV